MALYIGLMSGTSLDAIDAALVEITDNKVSLLHTVSTEIPSDIKGDIQLLMTDNGADRIDLLGTTDARLGLLLANATQRLLDSSNTQASAITAIGSHGQTIRHRPQFESAFTLQIGDASRIAENTGITTITDFRRRDIAAGGQGAPLVPAFHRAIFGSNNEDRCIVNIGGMANISYLPANPESATSGFDTGPGNILLDTWCLQHTGQPYDKKGDWAKSGELDQSILKKMLQDDYFLQPAPKSTGREYFNADWIQNFSPDSVQPSTVQRCLTELTAQTITDAIDASFGSAKRIILCGGGSHNAFLTDRIRQSASSRIVESSDEYGLDADWVEAAAFAWFAHCTLNNIPANEPAVTGAKAPVMLGAIYPA